MSVRERLEQYINYKGISNSDFCRSINVSPAFITSMRVSIQPEKLKSIALTYTDLNIEWLLTGIGDMQKPEVSQTHVEFDSIQRTEVNMNVLDVNKLIDYIRFKDAAGHEQIQKFYEHLNKGHELLEKNMSNSHEQISESQKLLEKNMSNSHEELSESQKQMTSNQELLKGYMCQNKEQIDRLITVIEKMNDVQYVPKKTQDHVLLNYNVIQKDGKQESMDNLVLMKE